MISKRLEDAAAAAGYAMVNPEDFDTGINAELHAERPETSQPDQQTPRITLFAKNWLSWDYARLMGTRAPA